MKTGPALLAVVALSLSACAPQSQTEPQPEPQPEPRAENAAPPLVLDTLDGSGTMALEEQEGKVVLVDLWATWCVPCIQELPHLQKLSETFGEDDFLMLGIVLESGERDEVVEFMADKDVTYPQVMGVEGTSEAFGPFLGYPTKYLIDRSGLVVKRYFGIVGEQLEVDVSTLIRTGALATDD